MITLFCNNTWLDMAPDSSIRMEQVMSHFQTDIFQGDISFPFELPVSSNNVSALGALHLLDMTERQVEFRVQMYWHNVKRADAKLVVQKANRVSYSINIVFGLAGIEILDKKLPELDLGDIRTIGTDVASVIAHANATSSSFYPSVDYNFPSVWNPAFYGDANPLFSGIVNRYNLTTQSFVAGHSSTDMISFDTDALVPFPYLAYVIKQGFAEAGYEVKGDFLTHPDWSQALLYSNRALDKPVQWSDVRASVTSQHTGSQILFADDFTPPNTDVNNLWIINNPNTSIADSSFLVNFLGDYTVSFDLDLLSQTDTIHTIMTLRMLVDGVIVDAAGWDVTAANVSFPTNRTGTLTWTATSANIQSRITFEVDSIDSNGFPLSVDIYSGFITITLANPTLIINTLATEFNLQNHVPNITFGELLKRLRNRLCLEIKPDVLNQVITISFTESTLSAPCDADFTEKVSRDFTIEQEPNEGYTLTDSFPSSDQLTENNFKSINSNLFIGEFPALSSLPAAGTVPGKISFIQNQNAYYLSEEVTPSVFAWKFYSDRHYPVIIGGGSEEISSELVPLFMREATMPGGTVLIPKISQPGQSTSYVNGLSEFTDTRIVFWKGKLANQSGNLYPFSTSANRDCSGNIIGSIVYRWEGADGIYELYYRNWLSALLKGEIVRWIVNFTLLDLLNMTDKKKRIRFQSYLFRKVSTLFGKTIEASEVEMIKL